jgi:hypothetical protein
LDLLAWYEETQLESPKEIRGIDKGYWMWDYPVDGKQYMIAADVGRGDGLDHSAFHVLDVATLEQVAEYKGQIDTRDYARLLMEVGRQWNDALIVVENQNIGWDVIQEIVDKEYPNIYYTEKDKNVLVVEDRKRSNKYNQLDKTKVPGFTTTMKNRPMMVSRLEEYFREKEITVRSSRLLAELKTFIWKNGKAQAADGYNDDLVMAYCICLWIRDTAIRIQQEGIDRTRAQMNSFTRVTSQQNYSNTPLIPTANKNPHNVMDLGGGKVENLDWLF